MVGDLAIELPPGWVKQPASDGPTEYWATADGSTGLLQVSELEAGGSFTAAQEDLGAFAAALGARLGNSGPNWGTAGFTRQGECRLGRFGVAVFSGGQFPTMILWVTVSEKSALMWTWFGPSSATEEVKQAFQLVLAAGHGG